MSVIDRPFHVSPEPMQYVPKTKHKGHRRQLSKSKSMSNLDVRQRPTQQQQQLQEPAQQQQQQQQQQQVQPRQQDKDYSQFEKVLTAVEDDFQDVDLRSKNTSKQAITLKDINDLKKLHDTLQTQSQPRLKLRSSQQNLRLSAASLSSLGSPSMSVSRKFHQGSDGSNSSIANNLVGMASANSSVSSLNNNASFVRGLGINKTFIRRPSDNLSSLKNANESEHSFDSKSDTSSLDIVNEFEKKRIEEQISIPNTLGKSNQYTAQQNMIGAKKFNRPFSDDSMISSTSTNSNYDFEGFDSRVSSLTSVETAANEEVVEDKTPKIPPTPEFMKFNKSFRFGKVETLSMGNDANDSTISSVNHSSTTINSASTAILEGNNGSKVSLKHTDLDPLDTKTRENTLRNGKFLGRTTSMPVGIDDVTNLRSPTLSQSSTQLSPQSPANVISPGQRYKLRKQLSKKNLKAFRKEVNSINTKDEVIDFNGDETIDSVFFNIPYASSSTANFFSSNTNLSKSSRHNSTASLPLSPLINNNGDSDNKFASNLSKFYTESSETYVASELAKREENRSKLPSYIINQLQSQSSIYSLSPTSTSSFERGSVHSGSAASSFQGNSSDGEVLASPSSVSSSLASPSAIEELRMMSPEKLEHLSSTRPLWLPPKAATEDHKHQKQISEVFETYAKKEINKREKSFQRIKGMLMNNQKWFEMTVKNKEIHKPVIYSMRHLCWKTNIPNSLRFAVWKNILEYYDNKRLAAAAPESSSSSEQMKEETFEELEAKLQQIDLKYLEADIELSIKSIYPSLNLFQEGMELYEIYKKMLLMKKISAAGLKQGDETLIAVLLLYFKPEETYKLLELLKKNVFNETFIEKFNKNVTTNLVMKKYLEKHFADELPFITSSNLFKIFTKIDPQVLICVFDYLVLNNNYRICYCLILIILKFFHFGFLNLNQLSTDDNMFVDIDESSEFLDKFYHYYKKF